MFWIVFGALALLTLLTLTFFLRELVDISRARNKMGQFEDPDAEPIDNRPAGPLRWLY